MMHPHVTGSSRGNASADTAEGSEVSSKGAEAMSGSWEGVVIGGERCQSSRLEQRLQRLSSSTRGTSGADPKHVRPVFH